LANSLISPPSQGLRSRLIVVSVLCSFFSFLSLSSSFLSF
jgi:hypothetical protein